MTVPTAGSRPELLNSLIDSCALPPENVIIVATRSGLTFPNGVTVIEDVAEINIQRWWLRGIEVAEQKGADHVAVVNDDVSLTPRTLGELSAALTRTGAAIASPSRPPFRDGLHRKHLMPYEPRLWGSLWMLSLQSGLRPDTRYRWWYGDNDLDIRARQSHGGVVLVNVDYDHHHAGEGTANSQVLRELSDQDAAEFENQYRVLLRRSRRLNKLRHVLRARAKA